MITLRQLSLSRGVKPLLEHVDLMLHGGQRVGIVGANGSGKSSFFALLTGELHAESGDLDMPPRLAIATVAQEIPASDQPTIEYVLDGDARLRAAEQAMCDAEAAGDGTALAHAHALYDETDGYSARARAARVMNGLGFREEDTGRPVASLSGGWRVRLNLARALSARSDLLLLDEPTNHLDLDAVLWLEEWLRVYPGTLLMISHDRDFLDGVVDTIWHFDARSIRSYTGNYSAFEQMRAADLAQRQAMFTRQQREIAHLNAFIDRFRAKATKARAAQSRIKALARMEVITAAHVDTPFSFRFPAPEPAPRVLIRLDRASAGYAGRMVLENVTLELEAGSRIALLGPNGAGKTTMIKLLAGQIAPVSGLREAVPQLRLGYFAQHQLEQLRPDESPLQHLQRLDPAAREQDLRDFLGGFDFRGPAAEAKVGPFSGGEKARLALALIIRAKPNLLLLDEPTNHLDLEMRHALNLALQEYEGAVVLVSHDRHLLRTSADQFILVSGGAAQPFDGDLDDYRDWLRTERAGTEQYAGGGESRRDLRRREAEQRQRRSERLRPLQKEIAGLEKEMERFERDKAECDQALADPAVYGDARRDELKQLLLRQAAAAAGLERAEGRWLVLQEELEGLREEA